MQIVFSGIGKQRRIAGSGESVVVNMDTLGDLLTRIRNAAMTGKGTVEARWSRAGEAVSKILREGGYLKSVEIKKDGSPVRRGGSKRLLILEVAFGENNQSVINHIKRVSKPGRRIYVSVGKLPMVLRGYGLAIISTSKGVMTDSEARKVGVGGEVICEVW